MEFALGVLKQKREEIKQDETISPLARQYMINELTDAISRLTFDRYSKDIIMAENEQMKKLLSDNGIEYRHPDRFLAEAITPEILMKKETN